jgi:rod shape-determining protein MreD
MKPRVYVLIFLFIIPFQASLLAPASLAGITPDLALAVVYIIGLITGPREAVFAGIAVGLLQDLNSANFLGFTALTRGLVGLAAGLLGKRVLDIGSLSNIIALAVLSLGEGIVIALFMQIVYEDVPFFRLLFSRLLLQALYTGLLGTFLLRLISRRGFLEMLTRRSLQKEL